MPLLPGVGFTWLRLKQTKSRFPSKALSVPSDVFEGRRQADPCTQTLEFFPFLIRNSLNPSN